MQRLHGALTIHGLPRIDDGIDDLAAYTGVSHGQIRAILFSRRDPYTSFRIIKKRGGFRQIAHPMPALKLLQTWILRNILDRLHASPNCHGFELGSRLRDHAMQHRGSRSVLSLDVANFFGSIRVAWVTKVFILAGYASSPASILARLCTRDGVLPQGAPSSPKLANLCCYRMDRRLAALAIRSNMTYTRYADDISFSGAAPSALSKCRPLISHIVGDSGFTLNVAKTRLLGPRRPLVVTGLVVRGDDVGIGRRRLRELRARMHRAHSTQNPAQVASFQGWLDFVADVDPARYLILCRYVSRLRHERDSVLASLRLRAAVGLSGG